MTNVVWKMEDGSGVIINHGSTSIFGPSSDHRLHVHFGARPARRDLIYAIAGRPAAGDTTSYDHGADGLSRRGARRGRESGHAPGRSFAQLGAGHLSDLFEFI